MNMHTTHKTNRLNHEVRDSDGNTIATLDTEYRASLFIAAIESKLLPEEIKKLANSDETYKTLYNHAINCVDAVFHTKGKGSTPPMLPDFLDLGEDKFEGIKKLAQAYLSLNAEVNKLGDKLEAIRNITE